MEEKSRERENWSMSLFVAGSANHPGLQRIAAMTDMFVYVFVLGYFLFFICRTFKHCSSLLEQTPDLSASICLLLFKASPIFHNQNIEYYGPGPTTSFGMSLNFRRFVGFIILLFFFSEHVYFTYNNIIRLHFAHIF